MTLQSYMINWTAALAKNIEVVDTDSSLKFSCSIYSPKLLSSVSTAGLTIYKILLDGALVNRGSSVLDMFDDIAVVHDELDGGLGEKHGGCRHRLTLEVFVQYPLA